MSLVESGHQTAVQFTILSIIAVTYKAVVAFVYATTALPNRFYCDNAIIDKTLFDESFNFSFRPAIKDIPNFKP